MSHSELIQTQRKAWSIEEDQMLQELRYSKCLDWIEVARRIGGRNPSQCAQRWKRIKGYKLRRQWTQEEDDKLKNLVKEYGYHWSKISKLLPNRSGKQIREHYLNQLHPGLNSEPWSKEEDEKIIEIYNDVGGKWSVIQKNLQGRSENSIKNRFYSYLRNKYLKIKNPYYIVPKKEQLNLSKAEQKINSIVSAQSQEYSPQMSFSQTQPYVMPISMCNMPPISTVNLFPQFQILYPYFQFPQTQYLLQCLSNTIQQ
ncbi:unnamed protein product (macronuclear) [Paramecium tetraurelia]|uniref:Myb-like DNA-binding domain containing protein n=1 Tax=Paramecium tetraurelia TaxID=5888 RepID=A0EG04_PARTE|nr:uncharacterized protein GSPATT00026568001 [Paramecium tetraurelia]CAK94245.1 unnamed protein product [Paramecium tetraurelia]|eukprot:XP_001461618.1 hypothetical protein (macronuclear) [Paramecium tetraurelia strain d4-2]